MKLFFSEFKPDYDRYHFPYQVWLYRESGDDISKIYDSGFLPVRSLKDVFYLCRNLRTDLNKFEISSENRRILKKTEELKVKLVPLSEFEYNVEVQKLCWNYAEARLGKDVFPVPAIKSIFSGQVYTHVLVFEENNKALGYAVCFVNENLLQYAHAFYDLNFLSENLGARMILEAVKWAKETGKKFAYLGTCYEEKSLYKTEFKGVEFFNGFCWSTNLDELKFLIKASGEEYLLKNEIYLQNFYGKDLNMILDKFGVRVNC